MLHQFSATSNLNHDSITTLYTSSEVSLMDSITTPYFLTSSPPPPAILQSKNHAFLTSLDASVLDSQLKIYARRLTSISERLQVEKHILSKELDKVKSVQSKRKERVAGKHLVLKAKFVVSTEEIQKALEEAEMVTARKKKAKW